MSIEGPGSESETRREAEVPLIGIVDSKASVREEISRLIRSAGYGTAAFESIEAYLEDGRKRMDVAIPIIFATAQSEVLRAVALTDGAGSVLQKPFTEVDLLRAVRSALKFPGRSSRSK
jgi:FixJ family two-component response regulator